MNAPAPQSAVNAHDNLVSFHDLHPEPAAFRAEVTAGLRRSPKTIPPKFFYDKRGSELFDEICRLDEYYPTRTEIGLLERHAAEMAAAIGDGTVLIEFGSGSSIKIRLLLDRLPKLAAYMPIDISKEHLLASAGELVRQYPRLKVEAVCADYTRPLELPGTGLEPNGKRRCVFFPGSTIGNFEPEEAEMFLRQAAALVGPGGGLLIGVDLKKDAAVLHAAYNDARGVTADFNLNLLVRINAEAGGTFDLSAFSHRAFYNADAGRIEMHLVSERAQTVRIGDETFDFAAGEMIHTENSYKYDVEQFRALAGRAGFTARKLWTDDRQWFSLGYFEVVG